MANALKLIDISNNLGDAKSLITHPETTTHQKLTPEARAALGVTDGLLRLSVGLEDADDLCEDLEQALKAASGADVRTSRIAFDWTARPAPTSPTTPTIARPRNRASRTARSCDRASAAPAYQGRCRQRVDPEEACWWRRCRPATCSLSWPSARARRLTVDSYQDDAVGLSGKRRERQAVDDARDPAARRCVSRRMRVDAAIAGRDSPSGA